MEVPHIPVLLNEVLESYSSLDEGIFVDCTLGYSGHTEAILKAHPTLHVVGCDRDEQAIKFSTNRLKPYENRVKIIRSPFSEVVKTLEKDKVRGLLADIGVSSLQLDFDERGFGIKSDTLDMRMDQRQELSAYDVVNHYSQSELEEILREYGELRNWRSLATKICNIREKEPIKSAKKLATLAGTSGKNGRSVSPATLLFQAIRIEVNDELGELSRLLKSIENSDLDDCIVGIISFHSLEDRIVKRTFKTWQKSCICPPEVLRCECGNNHAIGQIISKKPLVATKEEIKINPRSRSAKLRLFHLKRQIG